MLISLLRSSLLKMFHVLQDLIKYDDWYVTVLANGITNLMRLSVSLLVIPDLHYTHEYAYCLCLK